jgi:conjugal transfer pilus assembly protein TraI
MALHPPARTASPRHSASTARYDARPVEALLEEHGALLARLKLCYGADRPTFERELLPLVRGYARYVHLLPATADGFFCEPGGLLRLGLETAFFALQGTDAHIFSGKATISERIELEPRWRLATLVGGLCSELHRALGPASVLADDGATWPACLGPLADWLAQRPGAAYRVLWRAGSPGAGTARETRGTGLFALPHVLPADLLQHLYHGGSAIVPHLLASIGGVPLADHNVLDRLVRRSAALVIERDRLARAGQGGASVEAENLARYLLDGFWRLAAAHSAWWPNQDKSRVWYALDGLFLLWPGCAHDVLALLATDELAGMPADAPAVLAILLAARLVVPRAPDQPTWSIRPPTGKGPQAAVKLSAPALLLAGTPLLGQPLDQRLAVEAAPAAARPVDLDVRTPKASPPPAPPLSPPATDAGTAQLSLLGEEAAPRMAGPVPPARANAVRTAGPLARFKAPLRLNPSVSAALAAMVAAHAAQDGGAGLCIDDDSVFIPMDQFQRLGVQPTLALRALREARLLTTLPGQPTDACTRPVNGTPMLGVRIALQHFEGLQQESAARPVTASAAPSPSQGPPC